MHEVELSLQGSKTCAWGNRNKAEYECPIRKVVVVQRNHRFCRLGYSGFRQPGFREKKRATLTTVQYNARLTTE